MGDLCDKGSQLRPHIVWFGESVPMIIPAAEITRTADILLVIGTSLLVYPAAGLIHEASSGIPKYLVDPNGCQAEGIIDLTVIAEKAGEAVPELVSKLLE